MDTWKEFEQNVISHSAAHHLMAIDDLMSKLGYARVSDIARRLNITRGSVSISLKPMKEAGMILQDENRHLRLSDKGQRLVNAIKTKRLLMQRLLTEVLGVEQSQAEIDACKMEHLTSNETARNLVDFFRFIDSKEQPAGEFLTNWRDFNSSCEGQTENCPTCRDNCMSNRVEDE